MRIGFDATPLLGRRTGIGRYVEAIAHRLPEFGDAGTEFASTEFASTEFASTEFGDAGTEFVAAAFSRAPASALRAHLSPAISARSTRVPARVLHEIWRRTELLPVSTLCGPLDLFHGTNFVLPPLGTAKGVLTVHDLTYLRFPDTVTAASARYAHLVPRGIERADVICALTDTVAHELAQEYGLDRSQIVVTAPGVDDSWFDAQPLTAEQRDALGIGEDYIVAVGTLEPRKNLALLVAAHAALRARTADVPPLVLAGPPGWGPDIGARPENVVLIGYTDTPMLQSLVAGARLLAFPSRYEGFGLPPLEALAAGTPVVAADLPVTREVLGAHAVFFASGDRLALQEALTAQLHANPAQPNSDPSQLDSENAGPREQARLHARNWTWDRCVRQVFSAYAKALSC